MTKISVYSKKLQKITAFLTLLALFFLGGCESAAGIASVLTTPTRHEKKVLAEYDLTENPEQKVLVIVEQSGLLYASGNMRRLVSEAVNKMLVENAGIENVVSYDELSEFRSGSLDFSQLTSVDIGKALSSDKVLKITIDEYKLSEMAGTGFLEGFMGAEAILYDTAGGEVVWPTEAGGRSIKVGFDVEDRGGEIAVRRLAAAMAHCTTRSLYNCTKDKFKIADDRSGEQWEKW